MVTVAAPSTGGIDLEDRPPSVLVLRNPAARRVVAESVLQRAAGPLRARGWEVDIVTLSEAGEATHLAAEAAADGARAVVACGGDGTVHEVVNGLAGSETALGVVRGGTADVWAREAHVPSDPHEALALLPRARPVRVDLGVAEVAGERRRFLLMCGVGVDAAVVDRVGHGSRGKRILGRGWYGVVGLGTALRYRPVLATVRVGEQASEVRVQLAVAGNTRLYGGVARLASAALIDDGMLDLVTFAGTSVPGRLRQTLRALRGGLDHRAGGSIAYGRSATIEFEPRAALPAQVDGEFLGEALPGAPLRLGVEPLAVTVLLAPEPNALLGERGGR